MTDGNVDFQTDSGNCAVVMRDGKVYSVLAINANMDIFTFECECGEKTHVISETGRAPICCPMCGGASYEESEEDDDFEDEDEVVK